MKNPTIELMRFVFCAVILFMHGNKIFHEQIHIAPIGYLAVEFFFIVSGYLMVQSCERSADTVTRLGAELKETTLMDIYGIYRLCSWL